MPLTCSCFPQVTKATAPEKEYCNVIHRLVLASRKASGTVAGANVVVERLVGVDALVMVWFRLALMGMFLILFFLTGDVLPPLLLALPSNIVFFFFLFFPLRALSLLMPLLIFEVLLTFPFIRGTLVGLVVDGVYVVFLAGDDDDDDVVVGTVMSFLLLWFGRTGLVVMDVGAGSSFFLLNLIKFANAFESPRILSWCVCVKV
jgi:hypothetical protein